MQGICMNTSASLQSSISLNYDIAAGDERLAFGLVEEVLTTLFPTRLVKGQSLHQIIVVFQLRIHHLHILLVLAEQLSHLYETLSDVLAQLSHSLALLATDPS